MSLLEVSNLQVHFQTPKGVNRAVEGLSFDIDAGETVAIVGESGCGKSVSAMSILQLIPQPPGRIAGSIRFAGRDLLRLSEAEMRSVRGAEIGMIFQEPMSSLNPVLSIGRQIAEAFRLHQQVSRREAMDKAIGMLELVGIPSPAQRAREYPHQLSGGMRQRIVIAIALACRPQLLIADEPTTALDVTIQAQILELMRELKERTGSAIMLITHDLGIVAEFAQRVIVMYAGRKVEEARVAELFAAPLHPYTAGLLGAVPRLGASLKDDAPEALTEIPGMVPDLKRALAGCVFADRCPNTRDACRSVAPALEEKRPGRFVACHFVAREVQAATDGQPA